MVTWRDRPAEHDHATALAEEATAVLRARIDLTGLPGLSRAVTERIICASADLGYATDLVCSEPALEAAVQALAIGAPVVADAPIVAAGITDRAVMCKIGEPLAGRLARTAEISLPAAAVRLALGEAGQGAIWVVGREPAAIFEILARGAAPALVIGMPAGLAGAAEAKKALRGSGVPALTNVSEKGGPVVAAAALMALLEQALARAPMSVQPRPRV